MRTPKNDKPIVESLDKIAAVISSFDYGVEADDFILYEIARLIEEDRASLEDEDFSRIVDEGIREHIEANIEVRARLAGILRETGQQMDPETRLIASRIIQALESDESNLRNVGVIVRTYTAYLFEKLEAQEEAAAVEGMAGTLIRRWQNGEILREELVAQLRKLGNAAAGPAADLLFESEGDRMAAETAITILGGIRSSVSARVLAHAVSEPTLDEDLEAKAFDLLRELWPLPRNFMIYGLRNHTHEDIPYRWFELFVEKDEIYTVDLALEELFLHGGNAEYHEDLKAVFDVLLRSRDPEIEPKIIGVLNMPNLPRELGTMLQNFLKEYRPPAIANPGPWKQQELNSESNRKYVAAAKLFDAGKLDEARRALDQILAKNPDYPFAAMLRNLADR